jgi:pimeloyl-ACP methyl ester carboxylesterase
MIPLIVVAGVLAFLLVAGGVYQFAGARRSARRYPPPGTFIDADGQPLHVVCAGSGRPMVLCESGIAASSLSWTRVLPDIAEFTHVCAYDRAGLGWSEPARTPRTLARLVAELHGVVAHSSTAGSAVLVGHSFGAFLVCAYTCEYPGEVAGLVLLDPPSEWHEMTRRQARLLRGGILLSRIGGFLASVGVVRACLALLTGGAPGIPRNVVRMFGPTTARTVERLVGEVRKLPAEVHPIVQALWCQPKCFRAMAEYLAALEEITAAASRVGSLGDVPLVIISSHDQPPDTVSRHRALARLSSQGRHMIATGSGHWIQFDEPGLVVSAVRDIVERLRNAGSYS